MSDGISALIKKSNLGRIKNLEDLIRQSRIKYGLIKEKPYFAYLNKSKDPIIRKIIDHINNHPEFVVHYREEALSRVKFSEYAFIAKSTINEYIADSDCNYTVINGNNFFRQYYAIALPKGSKYLTKFNNALKILETTGKLNKLRDKYWRSKCLSNSAHNLINELLTLLLIIQVLTVLR
jgi:hypothetical protein